MNFFNKYKWFIWILAGLLIAALSALASVGYFTWKERKQIETIQACSSSCQMLATQIGMDTSQNAELHRILERYRDTSERLLSALRENRMALMTELKQDPPDTAGIRRLAERIGVNQGSLVSLAAAQYLQIRSVCTPEQQGKLSDIYCDLFGCPRTGMGHSEGNGPHRHRKARSAE